MWLLTNMIPEILDNFPDRKSRYIDISLCNYRKIENLQTIFLGREITGVILLYITTNKSVVKPPPVPDPSNPPADGFPRKKTTPVKPRKKTYPCNSPGFLENLVSGSNKNLFFGGFVSS